MSDRTDIKLLDNDVVFQSDDLVLIQSDDQHIIDTINAAPGWWKENPADGVGIMNYLKSKNSQEAARKIQVELQSDGYRANPVLSWGVGGKLTIQTNIKL